MRFCSAPAVLLTDCICHRPAPLQNGPRPIPTVRPEPFEDSNPAFQTQRLSHFTALSPLYQIITSFKFTPLVDLKYRLYNPVIIFSIRPSRSGLINNCPETKSIVKGQDVCTSGRPACDISAWPTCAVWPDMRLIPPDEGMRSVG